MPQIQKIEPSRVVHELILKPFGTYLIRASTENDDILSQIRIKPTEDSSPYVVLSVRVDENEYHYPIINYRLPFIECNNEEYLIEYYKQIQNTFVNNIFPELEEECIIKTENTNWKIDKYLFQMQYMPMYLSNNNGIKLDMRCSIQDGNRKIKVFKKLMKNDEQEFLILQTLSYFHCVTFYGICDEIDNKMKSLIFADNGESLKTKYINELLTIKQLSMIGYQIACGMFYLESKYIIHRDLHAGNILIDEKNFIRIADFEHAIIIYDDNDRFQESTKNPQPEFKIRRLAPECLPQLPENDDAIDSYETIFNEFSSKSDVWAYGLIFIELIIGINNQVYSYVLDKPTTHDDEETRQLVQYVKIDRNIHRQPDHCPENFYNVLKRCWEYLPNDRISFMDLRDEMLRIFKSEIK